MFLQIPKNISNVYLVKYFKFLKQTNCFQTDTEKNKSKIHEI